MSLILFSVILSFVTAWLLIPWLIRYLKRINIVVHDANKENQPLVPISGGLAVFFGFFIGIMFFIFYRKFFPNLGFAYDLDLDSQELLLLFGGLLTIFIITLIGFLDDLIIKPSKEASSGLRQWQKPLLTLIASVPLMAVNAGVTTMAFPFLDKVNFGILYPLVLVPIGIVGASNMVNMLAGFNGMETGMGIINLGMLGLYAFVHERYVAALIAVIICPALLAFYYYNRYPAKILPGDSLTYLIGGAMAVIAIIGNIERAALVLSIPFLIEFFLKARKRFNADSFGYYKDGKIFSKYDKIYSIPHIFTRTGKFTEKQITYFMMGIAFFFSLLIWVV